MNLSFRYSDEMYNYCLENNLCGTGSKITAAKNFELLLQSLDSDEEIYFIFVGLHNFKSALSHYGEYAYAITNKQIIAVQKQMLQKKIHSVKLDYINDISMKKIGLWGSISIDTMKEKLMIGCSQGHTEPIYQGIKKALDDIKAPEKSSVTSNPVEQVKQLKELLDMGILTQEEFDKKKKELLGL